MGMLFAKSKILMDRDGADLEDEFGIYDVPPALKIQLEVRLCIYILIYHTSDIVTFQVFTNFTGI